MIIPDGSADDGDKKAKNDYTGAIKIATAIVIGLLTIVGFGWDDLFGGKKKSSSENKKSDNYEDVYLDEEIDEDALDEKETGLKNSESDS
mgnify:CR=1 FL=1